MKNSYIIRSVAYPHIMLRTIRECDTERLRTWKNDNRIHFFFSDYIGPVQQREWFSDYLLREQDLIFLIVVENFNIGCMGFRRIGDFCDIYNVILGNRQFSKSGYMSHALRIMCSFILEKHNCRISAKVLKNNPALGWYRRNGFRETMHYSDHVEIALDLSLFEICEVSVFSDYVRANNSSPQS